MTDPLASASELADYSGMTLPADLARWQLVLRLASAEIRGFTGQTLSPVAGDQITFRGVWGSFLFLPELPVTNVTAVVVEAVTLSVTDYEFTSGGMLISPTGWADGATVTYDHGYAEGSSALERVKAVCMDAALRAITLNERSASEAMGSTIMESAGYSPEVFLTTGEQARLSEYVTAGIG